MLNILQMSLLMLFHPKDALDIIKRERAAFKPLRPFLLMLVFALVNYTYTFYVNYVLATKTPEQANIMLDFAIAFLPLLTWVVSAYAITAIVVGECSITELLTASAYCLTPIIVLKPLLGVLSLILTSGEADIFNGLCMLMYAWTIILLIFTLKHLNDYSLLKTVAVVFISIVAMLIIWGVIILMFTLFAQVVSFIKDLIHEFQLKY